MLRAQQKQLNQLMQSFARFQDFCSHDRFPRHGPVICRQFQQPGHFARLRGATSTLTSLDRSFPSHSATCGWVPSGSSAFGKLVPAELQSHNLVGEAIGSSELTSSDSNHHLISSCPDLVVGMGGVKIPYLIDTGSMVSTITESCFLVNFAQCGQERLRLCQWLQLRAANGLEIPYIG